MKCRSPFGPRHFRVSKKWLNATFLSFTGFASRKKHEVPPRETGRNRPAAAGLRAAKSAKYENLWVFIRSDAHPPGGLLLPQRGNSPCVVRAGLNIRGCGPLSTPGFSADWRPRNLRSGDLYCYFYARQYHICLLKYASILLR